MSDGKLCVAVGSSRSGKSWFVRKMIARALRAIVWDVKGEYLYTDETRTKRTDFLCIRDPAKLRALIESPYKAKNIKIAYYPKGHNLQAEFDAWARCALVFALTKRCEIVAEELSDVTSPAKAPAGWGMLLRKVLCTGSNVYAVTQRPAESDKTCMGNATYFHCGRLARDGDRKYMAAEMDIDRAELAALKPLQYIEKWASGEIKRGKMR